jgi:hypothetical protein
MNSRNLMSRTTLALGCLCLVGGAFLVGAKHLSPAAGEYAASGLRALSSGGLLAVLGVVLVAVAWGFRSHAPTEDQGTLVLEQLASDLATVRAQLEAMRTEREAQAAKPKHEDQLFRLAAGIDQLGARVDGRLKSQHSAIMDGLDGVQRDVAALRARIDELESAPRDAVESAEPGEDPYGHAEDEIELVEGFETSDDDLEVVVELDQDLAGAEDDQGFASLHELLSDPAVREAMEAVRRKQS